MPRTKKKVSVFDAVTSSLLVLVALCILYPLWYIISASLSHPMEVVKDPLVLYPKGLTLYNFKLLLGSTSIWLGYRNTLFYVVVGTAINVALTFLTAYALSQPSLPYRKQFSFLIVLTLFFSGGMIPTYLVVKELGFLDTVWSIVLPGAIATWNLLITRTYLSQQIPYELIEAAEMDGAGEYRTLIQIVTPLSKPILAVITLFYASGHWNSFFNALIYLRDRALYPLQLVLREILLLEETMGMMQTEAASEVALYTITLKYAVMVVSILPLIIVFPFVQRFFVKGVMIGALKG
jgi:putative aldouronate transport system permease protein